MVKRNQGDFPLIHPDLPIPKEPLFRLNPSTKKAWLKDLRSGKFHKGTCRLRYHDKRVGMESPYDKFCCIGVLANKLDSKAWEVVCDDDHAKSYSWHGSTGTVNFQKISPTLARVLSQPIDYKNSDNESYSKRLEYVLMAANDSGKVTFEEIALWIERYL